MLKNNTNLMMMLIFLRRTGFSHISLSPPINHGLCKTNLVNCEFELYENSQWSSCVNEPKRNLLEVSQKISNTGELSVFLQLNHSTDHCLNYVIPISKLWKDKSDLLSFWANGCNCSGNFEILGFTRQAIKLSLQLHIMPTLGPYLNI